MSVPMFYNEITNQWEPIVTSDRLPIIDLAKNYDSDNLEGALQEIAKWKNEIGSGSLGLLGERIDKAESNIEWLKVNGGAGLGERMDKAENDIAWLKEHGGGGGSGAVVPTITSTIPEGQIKLDAGSALDIPIVFSSANLGDGVCYIMVDNIETNTQTVKQGVNTINIGALENLKSTVSLYVKDRSGLVSNTLVWTVINGGIELTSSFDFTDDYVVGTEIVIPYEVVYGFTDKLKMTITIDYDTKTVDCENGYNDFELKNIGVGVHNISMVVSDGTYTSNKLEFSIVILDSQTLYLSCSFDNSDQQYGVPITIPYRISYSDIDKFIVKLYLDNKLYKTLNSGRGNYSWVIGDRIDVGTHTYKIEVINGSEILKAEGKFNVVSGAYTPVNLATSGMTFRLDPSIRSNNDEDAENPLINGYQMNLYNFNYSTNGWLNGELVCNGGAYATIDFKPYETNAILGSTVEIYFKSEDIGQDKAMVIDYRDTGTNKGFYIGMRDCKLESGANAGKSFVYPDKYMKVSFVIDRKNKFAKIFLNGVCSRAFQLLDTGSGGVSSKYEDFAHSNKIYINYNTKNNTTGSCYIKDIVGYRRALSDDEIIKNGLYYEEDLRQQELDYNFEFNNTSLPQMRMYLDKEELDKMTLEHKVTTRLKYVSTNTEKYGQSFDLPYCQVGWQGTSSIAYVLKNFQVYLKDENMADYYYTPFPNGVPESTFCFKADYMESSHTRNVSLARIANDIIFSDVKNPAQLKNPNVRNSIDGFPMLLYINDELQGVYDFNSDRYSNNAFGYTDEEKHLSYEIAANSETTAGAFNAWSKDTGTTEINYYKSDFMCLYPPTRAAGNDDFNEIKRVVEFVDKSSDEDFKDNFDKYFNKQYVFRYLLFVHLFGLVDNLGKNMKLTSWDGGNIWYIQPYDCDTSIGLDNTGLQKFDSDIEIGDPGVYNTTNSRLWSRVILLFEEELKQEYALLRNGKLNLKNSLDYLINQQISKIPASMYNKDMQKKYLDFGGSYLYALHGSSENMIVNYMTERFVYIDSLYRYDTDILDYITIRSGAAKTNVYIDVQTFCPMYFKIKWENSADNSGIRIKRIGKDADGNIQPVRFEYYNDAPDQEILLYGGKYIKNIGDLTILQPTTMLISNANKLTKLVCHSDKLVNTDLSSCINLSHVDLSNCTNLGLAVGSQSTIDVSPCKNLKYLNCENTNITNVKIDPLGSNVEELWFSKSLKSLTLNNCPMLKTIGFPIGHNCKDISLTDCPNVKYFGDNKWNSSMTNCRYPNAYFLSGNINSIRMINSCLSIKSLSIMYNMNIESIYLRNMPNIEDVTLGMRINLLEGVAHDFWYNTFSMSEEKTRDFGNFKMEVINCPKLKTFNTKTNLGRESYEGYLISYKGQRLAPRGTNIWPPVTGEDKRRKESGVCNSCSGFHANSVDLSKTQLENINFGITSYIGKLALPTTLKSLKMNSFLEYNNYKSKSDYGYTYTTYWQQQGGEGVAETIFSSTTVEGTCPSLIYSIASSIDNCESYKWKMGDFNLTDLSILWMNHRGTYFGQEWNACGDYKLDPDFSIDIEDLKLKANIEIPMIDSYWKKSINGILDLSNYKGTSMCKAFSYLTENDNLDITLPNSYDNILLANKALYQTQRNDLDWSLAESLFPKFNQHHYQFTNTILKEQESENEAIDLISGDISINCSNGFDNVPIGNENTNLKYINNVEFKTYYNAERFKNMVNLKKVGNVLINKATNYAYMDAGFNSLFDGCTNLESVENITIDYNNGTTWQNGNYPLRMEGLFKNCTSLKKIGNIRIYNLNKKQEDVLNKNGQGYVNFTSLFDNCTNLISYGNIEVEGTKISNLERAFYGCSSLTSIRIPSNLRKDLLNLINLCRNCINATEIKFLENIESDFSNVNFNYSFSGCEKLTNIIGLCNPLPINIYSEATFYECRNLLTYYHIDTTSGYNKGMSQTYYNCEKMNSDYLKNNTIIRKYTYDSIYSFSYMRLDSTYKNMKNLKKSEIQIYMQDLNYSLPKYVKDEITYPYILLGSIEYDNSYTGSSLEELTIGIFSNLDPFKFVLSFIGFGTGTLKKLTFNKNVNDNTSGQWLTYRGGDILSTNQNSLITIEKFPLNSKMTVHKAIFGPQLTTLTWEGTLTSSYDLSNRMEGYIPVSSLKDLINNHLGTVTNATLKLGNNIGKISSEDLATATNKGWNVTG